jgi:predicted GNAT family N-acyltransferase
MNNILVDKIQNTDIENVANILTEAFETNPAYALIFKNEDLRKDGLFWVFKTSLILNNRKQLLTRVIREKNTGKIIGTFTLIPPKGVKNNIFIYSKIGLLHFISKYGIKPLIRMLSLDNCNKSSLANSIKASEYYYLSMVVIQKEYRGTGIGSYVITQAIKELASSNPICNLMGLTTQLPENVIFYSRLGFEKLDEGYINFKGDKYYNYNMKLNISS